MKNDPIDSKQTSAQSESTIARYQSFARIVVDHVTKSLQSSPEDPVHPTPMQVVEWLIANRWQYKRSTFGVYRSAMLWALSTEADKPGVNEAYLRLAQTPTGPIRDKSLDKGVYARTKKTISRKDFATLTHALSDIRGRNDKYWGLRVVTWIRAGLASGLRPGEWKDCHLSEDKRRLIVRTLKTKRAPAAWIRINQAKQAGIEVNSVHDLPPLNVEEVPQERWREVPIADGDLVFIENHLDNIATYLREEPGRAFETYYNNCRNLLRETCLRTFDGKVMFSLGTMRGQFSANQKAGLPLTTVAERLGNHPRTASKHYGHRRNAHSTARGMTQRDANTRLQDQTQQDNSGTSESRETGSTSPSSSTKDGGS